MFQSHLLAVLFCGAAMKSSRCCTSSAVPPTGCQRSSGLSCTVGGMKQAPGRPRKQPSGQCAGLPTVQSVPAGPGTVSRAGLRSPAELGTREQPWGVARTWLGRGALLLGKDKVPFPSPFPLRVGSCRARAQRLLAVPWGTEGRASHPGAAVEPGTPGRPSLRGGQRVPLFQGWGPAANRGGLFSSGRS